LSANSSKLCVQVPASTANLGPGFDVLGMALGLHLRCTLTESTDGFHIVASGTDADTITKDETNLIWRAFSRLAGGKENHNFQLEIDNHIPIGKGLGSSAAATVAGLALANEWHNFGHGKEKLVRIATEMEGHPDNVAAAARGGLVMSCQTDDGDVISLNIETQGVLEIALVVPQFKLSTEKARAALPASYSRKDAVFNLQRLALLLASLRDGHHELLAEAMRDRMHQPFRAALIPGFAEMLKLKGIPGMHGIALSGAGPSVLALCSKNTVSAGEAISSIFRKHGIESKLYNLPVDSHGLVVEWAK